jgi:uncharacterized membrane-anchored protein YhcB (DUF1043 family)
MDNKEVESNNEFAIRMLAWIYTIIGFIAGLLVGLSF